jgi:RNA recognition motif-containing protein
MEASATTPQRSAYLPPHARSQNSNNWRVKDETPRAEASDNARRDSHGPKSPSAEGSVNSPRHKNASFEPAPGTRLYVGNLLYTCSREDVEGLFTSNGYPITGISMSVDPFTGRNPSYAFVDFETAEEASAAMENINGMELLGREVKVHPGVRKQSGAGERRVKDFANGGAMQRDRNARKSSSHTHPKFKVSVLSFPLFHQNPPTLVLTIPTKKSTKTTPRHTTVGTAPTEQATQPTPSPKACASTSAICRASSPKPPPNRPSNSSSPPKASTSPPSAR